MHQIQRPFGSVEGLGREGVLDDRILCGCTSCPLYNKLDNGLSAGDEIWHVYSATSRQLQSNNLLQKRHLKARLRKELTKVLGSQETYISLYSIVPRVAVDNGHFGARRQ